MKFKSKSSGVFRITAVYIIALIIFMIYGKISLAAIWSCMALAEIAIAILILKEEK